jgi:hypothetical protein
MRLDSIRRPIARLGPKSSHVPDIGGCELTGMFMSFLRVQRTQELTRTLPAPRRTTAKP